MTAPKDDDTGRRPPILRRKDHQAPSIFTPDALLREARRQKGISADSVPDICILDLDGDIVRHLRATNRARGFPQWACYHTELHSFEHEGLSYGIVGCAVGAAFAVLVAEELFASGCKLLISITSAGQILPVQSPPYFIIINRALRDEGTSCHYLPPADYSIADRRLIDLAEQSFATAGPSVRVSLGPNICLSWREQVTDLAPA